MNKTIKGDGQMNDKFVYIPTKEEKEEIIKICSDVIDLITKRTDNHIGKMAFIMDSLYKSFWNDVKL